MEIGFFNQTHVEQVIKAKSLTEARTIVSTAIETFKKEHPTVRKDNLVKAEQLVTRAKNPTQLAFAVQNFILAHPSENLRVVK